MVCTIYGYKMTTYKRVLNSGYELTSETCLTMHEYSLCVVDKTLVGISLVPRPPLF